MKLKSWFIAAILLVVCVGFSFQGELDTFEDAPVEDEAQELEDNFDEEEDTETDLEDPTKVRRPFCPKFLRRKCIVYKNCGKLRRFCICVRRYRGDEPENEDQVNDAIEEDEAEEVQETNLEDPSKRRRRCPRKLLRRCFVVKIGYRKRRFCVCARRCYGDETENDNQVSNEFPQDEMDEDYDENVEEMSDPDEEGVENSALEDPWKLFRRRCPKYSRRRCFIIKRCYKRRRVCVCVKRRYGDEPENDIQLNDETEEDELEELEETSLEDPSKGRRRRCPRYSRLKCFVGKRGKRKRRICICVRPCYGDEPLMNDY